MIALLVAASALRGAQIEDGFYTALTNQSLPVVATRFGQPVVLGEKLQLHITKTQIVSRDNANNQFCAMFTVTNHRSGMDPILLLVEDGKVYPLEGETDMADHSVLNFPLSGGDAAKATSQRFGAQVFYRKHPGYNIAVSFTPARTQFEVGEEVPVALRIENVGSSSFTFMNTIPRPGGLELFIHRKTGWQTNRGPKPRLQLGRGLLQKGTQARRGVHRHCQPEQVVRLREVGRIPRARVLCHGIHRAKRRFAMAMGKRHLAGLRERVFHHHHCSGQTSLNLPSRRSVKGVRPFKRVRP